MKIIGDGPALKYLRCYFDEIKYAMVDYRLSFEAPNSPTGFPKFDQLQSVIARLDRNSQVIFRLFRLGEAVDSAGLQQALPAEVCMTLQRVGLLQHINGEWRTPNLLLLPVEGMLLFVSVPPSYPTATAPCTVWFDLSSYVFAKALPLDLSSQSVLDICSGSGVQSLLCAKRGARSVIGLELSAEAVELARLNAIFNGVGCCTEFRRSDKLEALRQDERFDFVLCNTPHAPVTAGPAVPSSLGEIGNRILFDFIDDLPVHLAPQARGIIALWRSIGTRERNGQRTRVANCFAGRGLTTVAFVERAQDGVQGALRILGADAKARHGTEAGLANEAAARALLNDAGCAVDGSYNQLIFFKAGQTASNVVFGLADATAAPATR